MSKIQNKNDNKKIWPNFFIIGAPKSGTTAMSDYLSAHPSILMSIPKEPHYFATDMERMRVCKTLDSYKSCFQERFEEIIVGEASVWYLYSTEAIKNIYEFNPEAKILVMLRNPVEMVQSMHLQNIESADEDILDFEEAWGLSVERSRKPVKTINARAPQNLIYTEIAKYSYQLERVYKHFPEHQVKIILFDDFKKSAKNSYEEVLSFLNLFSDSRDDFPVINASSVPSIVFLNNIIIRQPDWLISLKQRIKNILGVNNLGIVKIIHMLNRKKIKKKALPLYIKDEIINNYSNDIDRLSSLLGRDLSGWLEY